jgi:hypothetical protein
MKRTAYELLLAAIAVTVVHSTWTGAPHWLVYVWAVLLGGSVSAFYWGSR